jgi:cbb3-type cytochrome oxidase maturation protein
MNALYITIPIATIIASFGLIVFLVNLKKGQFEDLESAKHRIFFEDD